MIRFKLVKSIVLSLRNLEKYLFLFLFYLVKKIQFYNESKIFWIEVKILSKQTKMKIMEMSKQEMRMALSKLKYDMTSIL